MAANFQLNSDLESSSNIGQAEFFFPEPLTEKYRPLNRAGVWGAHGGCMNAVDCQCGHSKELHDTQHPYECFAEIAQDQQCKCERFALPHYPQHQVFDSTDTVCQGCQTDGREPHTCPDAV